MSIYIAVLGCLTSFLSMIPINFFNFLAWVLRIYFKYAPVKIYAESQVLVLVYFLLFLIQYCISCKFIEVYFRGII